MASQQCTHQTAIDVALQKGIELIVDGMRMRMKKEKQRKKHNREQWQTGRRIAEDREHNQHYCDWRCCQDRMPSHHHSQFRQQHQQEEEDAEFEVTRADRAQSWQEGDEKEEEEQQQQQRKKQKKKQNRWSSSRRAEAKRGRLESTQTATDWQWAQRTLDRQNQNQNQNGTNNNDLRLGLVTSRFRVSANLFSSADENRSTSDTWRQEKSMNEWINQKERKDREGNERTLSSCKRSARVVGGRRETVPICSMAAKRDDLTLSDGKPTKRISDEEDEEDDIESGCCCFCRLARWSFCLERSRRAMSRGSSAFNSRADSARESRLARRDAAIWRRWSHCRRASRVCW